MNAFVGIGLGAIQAGLFLPRAQEAELKRTVLVRRRIQAQSVAATRELRVNVARDDGLETLELCDVDAIELTDPDCRDALVAATEIAIAVPSVDDYHGLAPLLAEATKRKAEGDGPACLFYACQNKIAAAEALTRAIVSAGGSGEAFRALDTVISKISRTIKDPDEIAMLGLVPGIAGLAESWLVEAHDNIYISKPPAGTGFERRLPRLIEIDDLLPFEIAKLNGHNAAHSAFAYAGQLLGHKLISDVMGCQPVRALVREALLLETGPVLNMRFGGRDPLFTRDGWQRNADDLLARMTNPWLHDDCNRVGRNPERKLGWNDRLIGTIRLIESSGCRADRWRLAVHCAVEACGFTEGALAVLWDRAGAGKQEIDAMLRGQQELASRYAAWRNEIGEYANSRVLQRK